MSAIANLSFEDRTPAPSAALARVLRASVFFERLFAGLFCLLAFLTLSLALAMLFYTGPHLQVTPRSFLLTVHSEPVRGGIIFGTLPLGSRLAHTAMAPFLVGPMLMVFWHLRALFRLYGQGEVFGRENALRIQKVGLWLIAAAFAPLLTHSFLEITGVAIDRNWFHLQQVQELVLGGIVYVIAQVMQLGREIEEERSQFV